MKVKTTRKDEVQDITDKIQKLVDSEEIETGVATVFVKHTTCGLTTIELTSGVQNDFIEFLRKLIPQMEFRHEGQHSTDHLISSLLGTSLTVTIVDGRLTLGTWQRIVLVELNGPKDREIEISLTET